jgi:hypothetical protein
VKALAKLADCKRGFGALIRLFESFGDYVTRLQASPRSAGAVTGAAE